VVFNQRLTKGLYNINNIYNIDKHDMEVVKMRPEFRKVQQLGNSLVVSIPATFARQLSLSAGDYVRISLDGDKIIIEKADGREEE